MKRISAILAAIALVVLSACGSPPEMTGETAADADAGSEDPGTGGAPVGTGGISGNGGSDVGGTAGSNTGGTQPVLTGGTSGSPSAGAGNVPATGGSATGGTGNTGPAGTGGTSVSGSGGSSGSGNTIPDPPPPPVLMSLCGQGSACLSDANPGSFNGIDVGMSAIPRCGDVNGCTFANEHFLEYAACGVNDGSTRRGTWCRVQAAICLNECPKNIVLKDWSDHTLPSEEIDRAILDQFCPSGSYADCLRPMAEDEIVGINPPIEFIAFDEHFCTAATTVAQAEANVTWWLGVTRSPTTAQRELLTGVWNGGSSNGSLRLAHYLWSQFFGCWGRSQGPGEPIR